MGMIQFQNNLPSNFLKSVSTAYMENINKLRDYRVGKKTQIAKNLNVPAWRKTDLFWYQKHMFSLLNALVIILLEYPKCF